MPLRSQDNMGNAHLNSFFPYGILHPYVAPILPLYYPYSTPCIVSSKTWSYGCQECLLMASPLTRPESGCGFRVS